MKGRRNALKMMDGDLEERKRKGRRNTAEKRGKKVHLHGFRKLKFRMQLLEQCNKFCPTGCSSPRSL